MTRYAFTLDSSACSGCKACQVACKDKHDLPVGVLWRRVYEVAGGDWERRDGAWLNTVFAYNVSMACNHCDRPICLEVCPTAAIGRRDDGIVLIDADRCMGCRYCEWACPYGALQYHTGAGRVTKCTFCVEELDAGGSPACVAACPLRVLGFETIDTADQVDGTVFPLPDSSLTRPAFRVAPHPAAANGKAGRGPRVANGEEVGLGRPGLREPSLVAFTLLAQTAAGMQWAIVAGRWLGDAAGWPAVSRGAIPLAVSLLALAAMAIAFLHLGRPGNAWRAVSNVRSSWLSREILFLGLFAAGSTIALALDVAGAGRGLADLWATGTAAAGFGMVYSMARVYRLRTVPAWDTARTTTGFLATAAVLGTLTLVLLREVGVWMTAPGPSGGALAPLAAGLAVAVAATAAVRARVRFYASHEREGV